MWFWPKKLTFSDVLINSIWSLIAWVLWSVIILIITFSIWWIISIPGAFQEASIWIETNAIFPLVLSVITLIWTTITIFLTYIIAHVTNGERYKKNIIILGQIAFFAVMTYLFITPVYLYAGLQNYDYIMYVFLAHALITTFWTSILLEVLNNYRYVLLGLYGSFVGLFISIIITISIFSLFSAWIAKLISLIILLPIINFLITFFKQTFEILYLYYYKMTNQDQLWDIFYQIEMEEKESLREEEEKNSI